MSPTVGTKSFKKKEVVWQQYHLCMDVAEHEILGRKHVLSLGPESGKIWWLKKVQKNSEKVPLPVYPRAWRETQVDFSQSRQPFASTGVNTSLA